MNILLTVPAGEQLLPYLTTMVGEQDKMIVQQAVSYPNMLELNSVQIAEMFG